MHRAKVLNLYGQPSAGKSTTAMRLAADLKAAGYNAEYVQENVKSAVWEKRSPKYFNAQDLIFAKQHWDVDIVAQEVDLVITDSPIIMSSVYIPSDFKLPALRQLIREAHDSYDSLNILMLPGAKPYNPKGRNQTKEEAFKKGQEIRDLLDNEEISYIELVFDYERNAKFLFDICVNDGWVK